MVLSLSPNVSRFLISTTSRLVGELDTPNLRIQIMFPEDEAGLQTSFSPSPHSRNYFLISYAVPDDPDSPGDFAVPITTLLNGKRLYHHNVVSTMATDLASIWFGKRFDNHGPFAVDGIARLPTLGFIAPVGKHRLSPYNYEPRSDLGIPLVLNSLSPVLCLLFNRQPEKELAAFWTATRFYARALRAFDTDPEEAFFHLIVALEVIASQIRVPDDQLYDEQSREDLAKIQQLRDPKLANRVRDRYYQLRRRVVYTAEELVSDAFFDGSPAQQVYRLDRNRLGKRVAAAYDLRSRFVHDGMPFGIWLTAGLPPDAEIQVGRPVLQDSQEEDSSDLLASIPTFVGLERLIRFITLSFAHQTIAPIHEKLQKSKVA